MNIHDYIINLYEFFFDKNTLAFIGLLAAVFKWLYETQKQRKWETNKYLIERYKQFEEKPSTKQIHRILDYNTNIPIRIEVEDRMMTGGMDDERVIKALRTHDEDGTFLAGRISLRSTFDDYFDNLTELILLCKCGLIDEKNLRMLLLYYINILNGKSKRKDVEYIKTLEKYLKFYHYDLVLEFINKNPNLLFNNFISSFH